MKTIKKFCSYSLLAGLVLLIGCNGKASSKDDLQYVLAFSWQPAFCENAQRKQECKTQTRSRYDASHFSLHGLWPQPGSNIYCNIHQKEVANDKNRKWNKISMARLPQDIWNELRKVMPGTQSSLHKHEWLKHGTCTNATPADYYKTSIDLMNQINTSELRSLFINNLGKNLTAVQIRNSFDASFGKSAGQRLRMSCRKDKDSGRQLIVEITLGLSDPFKVNSKLDKLIQQAPVTDPGCPDGIVDIAGFQ